MNSKANTPKAYLEELPSDRREPIKKIRQQILDHLPDGFEEGMLYGMLGYYVPKKIYEPGYHVGKEWTPLPFINLASQKNYIALYHSGIYANADLHDWFVQAYSQHSQYKLDMGKSCIRFKRMDDIPYDLIGQLCGKMTPAEWIEIYERRKK
ncbi:DUF1801 domain-containing protein [Nonlabens xiamenensis]|uniref:DUF1801 domain-containing protein n=1 Tax=Nonlabens xiamenensis TaxID=2341043 RepID=UPI000F60B501|nr:DUF1801 domain-containing protein [Nonlabens xiamenensis]